MSPESELSRRSFLVASGGAASATVAGCLGDDGGDGDDTDEPAQDDTDDQEVQEGGELTMRNATMSSLDPIQSTDTASGIVINQVYENLTHYPDGVPELENQLAEEVEVSDDLLTYTFTVAEAQYHDGRELTAQDFEYAFRRLALSPNSQRANFSIEPSMLGLEHEIDEDEGTGPFDIVPDSLGVEAVDDRTFEMRIEQPQPAALDIVAYDSFGAVPEGLVDDIDGYEGEIDHDEFSTETMIGTGPFEFDEWVPESEARVTRFDDYHGETANLDSVRWRIVEDDDAMWTVINERNFDVFPIPTQFYEPGNVDAEEDDLGRSVGTYGPLENGDTVEYVGVPEFNVFYVAFNATHVPRPVRRAIAYVTDHQELIEVVFKTRGETAFSFTPPGMWMTGQDGYESYVEEWPYSPNETDREGARQVLEDAGFTQDDPFEMTLTTYADEAFQEFARLTRDKTDGLGIDLSIEEAEFGTLQSRGEDGDLEFFSLGWVWSWEDPAYGHFGFEPENTDTSLIPEEATGYYLDWQEEDSEHVQKAQDAWERIENNPEPDAEDLRNEAHVEIEEAVRDDMIMLPLYHRLTERFWYDHVHKAPTGSLGTHRQQLQDAWIEEQ